ncbi:high choriolytic enzyme 1-like isoform X2 [Thrips palmi]|uniref:Metalloendopeptidase n=1 Tax=Thrips palmi TaxID=161013 RepID=A0A6P8Z2G2_THRPL|nr:high choriolytic enzyme 1-like isoform X2 [Thrips palmi]
MHSNQTATGVVQDAGKGNSSDLRRTEHERHHTASLITRRSPVHKDDFSGEVLFMGPFHHREMGPMVLLMLLPVALQAFSLPDGGVSELLTNSIFQGSGDDDSITKGEEGSFIEGDIRPPPQGFSRNGLTDENRRWKDAIVPYKIEGNFTKEELGFVSQTIASYNRNTCIRIIPKRPKDKDYIAVINSKSGCWSYLGRIGGRQELNLAKGCFNGKPGTTIHEFMHAMGFTHEQNRADRDDYVTINWENIVKGHENNFKKNTATSAYGVKYDFNSVMHYALTAFSKNKKQTITPKNYKGEVGQRNGLSAGDAAKLNAMYKCNEEEDIEE